MKNLSLSLSLSGSRILKNRSGFTLVELMIVIGIIGILAASPFPSLTSYLARGRDITKISEIKQLNTALILYQVDNATYKVPDTGSNGMGWINSIEVGGTLTLAQSLQKLGYMSSTIKHKIPGSITIPQIVYNIMPCANPGSGQDIYMLYYDDSTGKYAISGYLENPKQTDIDNIILSYNGVGSNGTCTRYGMNYAVGQN